LVPEGAWSNAQKAVMPDKENTTEPFALGNHPEKNVYSETEDGPAVGIRGYDVNDEGNLVLKVGDPDKSNILRAPISAQVLAQLNGYSYNDPVAAVVNLIGPAKDNDWHAPMLLPKELSTSPVPVSTAAANFSNWLDDPLGEMFRAKEDKSYASTMYLGDPKVIMGANGLPDMKQSYFEVLTGPGQTMDVEVAKRNDDGSLGLVSMLGRNGVDVVGNKDNGKVDQALRQLGGIIMAQGSGEDTQKIVVFPVTAEDHYVLNKISKKGQASETVTEWSGDSYVFQTETIKEEGKVFKTEAEANEALVNRWVKMIK